MKKVILSLLVSTSLSIFSQVNVTDSLALVDFYNSTDGPNWTDNTNWLTGPVSSWSGITVDSGRVTDIIFYSNNMNGTLNSSLGDLTKLEQFTLNQNSGIIGNFPHRFWELSELSYLMVSNNSLSGALSDSIGFLENLKTLNLSINNFSGAIPDSIVNLKKLEALRLGNNDFDTMPNGIGSMITLKEFDIYGNNFSGDFPDTLYALTNLKLFWISSNDFYDTISTRIGDMSELTHIYWGNNDFYGKIPKEIGNLDEVTFLELYGNDLDGAIPEEISNMSSLKYLRLYNNNLSGNISDSLSKLNILQIHLYGNNFEEPFPNFLGKIKTLTHINLNNNFFYGEVDTSFGNLPSLTFFDISDNNISGISDMSADTNINWFVVDENNLTFEDLEPNMFDSIFSVKYKPQANVGVSDTFTLAHGDSIKMSVNVGGTQNQYQWYRDGVLMQGEDSSVLNIDSFISTHEGSYVCEVTNAIVTGLTISSEPILLIDSSVVTGIENRPSKIEIYPMPFDNQAIIDVSGKINTPFDIYIYDKMGRLVRADKNISATKLELIRGDMNAGNYFIEIIDGIKIIKARFLIN